MIRIDPNCFDYHTDGMRRTPVAAHRAKSRAIKAIINAILNQNLTQQQRALSLQESLLHSDVRLLGKSAGVIDNDRYNAYKYIIRNMHNVMTKARTTKKSKGRTTDDLRSIVQSIVLSTIPATHEATQDEFKQPPLSLIAEYIGIDRRAYRRIIDKIQTKRDALEEGEIPLPPVGTIFSQVIKRKGKKS